jgi:predicted cupin superfamily sugar epimerase
VVAAGDWQAARTTGEWTLVTCAVGPGFDFADFAMLADHPTDAEQLRRRFPGVASLI